MNTLRRLSFLLTVLALALFTTATPLAQDGEVDLRVRTDFFGFIDRANDVVAQPDGKIIAAGFASGEDIIANATTAALVRYHSGGSRDESFGADGIVLTDTDGDLSWGEDWISALALQPDGKIVAVGSITARYNPDGSLDSSFGTDGIILNDAFSVVVQPDGKIITNGRELRRYQADGRLDATFGTGGIVMSRSNGLVLQPDGKIVTAGGVLRRYNPDGSLDTSFGTSGVASLPFGTARLARQSDGKFVIISTLRFRENCDSEFGECSVFAVARLNEDGSSDLSFGEEGMVTTDFGASDNSASDLVIQPDDKIVVAGSAFISIETGLTNFAVARYRRDGSLDPTFGNGGLVLTDLTGRTNTARAITIQNSGKLVAAGSVFVTIVPQNQDFAIVWYDNSVTPQDNEPPSCGPISFEAHDGVYEIASSASDAVGIASVTFTRLTSNLDGLVDVGTETSGPFTQGDVFSLGSPTPTHVGLRARFTQFSGRFSFLVTVTDTSGNEALCDPVVSDLGGGVPEVTALRPPYPNPVHTMHNASVRVPFLLAESASVRLVIYDVLGRETTVAVDERMEAGSYESDLDISDIPSGMYLVRMTTNKGDTQSQWLTVVR